MLTSPPSEPAPTPSWQDVLDAAYCPLNEIFSQTINRLSSDFRALENKWPFPDPSHMHLGNEKDAFDGNYFSYLTNENPLYRHSALQEDSDPFLHASKVETPCQHYIACELPLRESLQNNFWDMVVREKPPCILNLVEWGGPTSPQGYVTSNDCFEIRMGTPKHLTDRGLTLQPLVVRRKADNTEHHLNYLHYVKWPDGDIPQADGEEFLRVLDTFDECLEMSQGGRPIIHCLAGKGRTGTFILIHSVIARLKRQGDLGRIKINLLEALDELRSQRWGAVQTDRQYHFAWQIVGNWFENWTGLQSHTATASDNEELSLGLSCP